MTITNGGDHYNRRTSMESRLYEVRRLGDSIFFYVYYIRWLPFFVSLEDCEIHAGVYAIMRVICVN